MVHRVHIKITYSYDINDETILNLGILNYFCENITKNKNQRVL